MPKVDVPMIDLNNGTKIPSIGLGLFQPDKSEVNLTKQIVLDALEAGYRHFDSAQIYNNEDKLGEAIAEWLKKDKNNKREDLYITTKLWNTFHEEEQVGPSLKRSLEKLKLDYIDLFLIHSPMAHVYDGPEISLEKNTGSLTHPFEETWQAMEKLVESGKVKSIGVSNFNKRQIERILKIAKIKPVVNQIESSIVFPNEKLIEFCKSKNIQVEAYAQLGNPGLFKENKWLLENPKIIEMAKKYKKTPAQLCIKYCHQKKMIVLPKSTKKERVIENLNILDFEISKEDMKVLEKDVEKRDRFYNIAKFVGHHAEDPTKDEF